MILLSLDSAAIRVLSDIEQLNDAWIATLREQRHYRGGLRWKRSGTSALLFRGTDREGNGRSLGIRSPKTETIYRDFHARREELRIRAETQQRALSELARYAIAARLNRAPSALGKVMHQLDLMRGELKSPAVMVGTNCLYAYELIAAVRLESGIMATQDADILQDNRHEILLVEKDTETLARWIRSGDRTYHPMAEGSFRLINNEGFMVDLITAPTDARKRDAKGRVISAEIAGLKWLLSSPRMERTVLDERGMPFRVVVPVPEAFALHKSWLAARRDRDALRRQRDRAQAECMFQLLAERLPRPRRDSLRQFPGKVRDLWPANLPFAD